MSHSYTANNGIRFEYQCSRFWYENDSSKTIRHELTASSEIYGAYAWIKRKGDVIEATLADRSGIPLGEAIQAHLTDSPNIVWCEQLEDEPDQCLVVLIKSGRIVLDLKISATTVDDGIRTELVTSDQPFTFYTKGDVPFAIGMPTSDGSKLPVPIELVSYHVELATSVFDNEFSSTGLDLVHLQDALKAARLGPSRVVPAAISIGLCGAVAYFVFGGNDTPIETPQGFTTDPYKAYRSELESNLQADDLVWRIYETFLEVSSIHGWRVKELTYGSGLMSLSVENSGGSSLIAASDWLQERGWTVEFKSGGLSVVKEIRDVRPYTANTISKLDSVISRLHDDFLLLGNAAIGIENTVNHDLYKKGFVKIGARDVTLSQWKYISAVFSELPVVVQSLSIASTGHTTSISLECIVIGK